MPLGYPHTLSKFVVGGPMISPSNDLENYGNDRQCPYADDNGPCDPTGWLFPVRHGLGFETEFIHEAFGDEQEII